jgi:hypothetical protein
VTDAPNADALLAEGSTITGLSVQQLQDWLQESPADQIEILDGWKALDTIGWTVQPDKIARLLTIFETIGTIAGVVGGVAGAAGAVAALGKL